MKLDWIQYESFRGLPKLLNSPAFMHKRVLLQVTTCFLMLFSIALVYQSERRLTTDSIVGSRPKPSPTIAPLRKLTGTFDEKKNLSMTTVTAVPTTRDDRESTTFPIIPRIYVITPTYYRSVQSAELTKMCLVLRLVRNLRWILVEDSMNKTGLVTRFLDRCPVPSVHLTASYNSSRKHKGIPQRNQGLDWIRQHVRNGVFYFADDDNMYDPQLFEEMRDTRKISVWPVALAGSRLVETPVVEKGKVVGWSSGFVASRKFAIDMAGFAINVRLLLSCDDCRFDQSVSSGYMETKFIQAFNVTLADLEPKASNCTKVLVWHTKTQRPYIGPGKIQKDGNFTLPDFDI